MKKIILLFSAILLLNINTTFALTKAQEEAMKPYIEKTFTTFESSLNKLDETEQKQKLEILLQQFNEKSKKTDDTSKFVISYLNTLIENKLKALKGEIGTINKISNNGQDKTLIESLNSYKGTNANIGGGTSGSPVGGVNRGDTEDYSNDRHDRMTVTEYTGQYATKVFMDTNFYTKNTAISKMEEAYNNLLKGVIVGSNDAINPRNGKTVYEEQVDAYNKAAGYYKDGKLFEAKQSQFGSNSAIKAFFNPQTGGDRTFKILEDYGYQLVNGKFVYDPNLNEVGPLIKYFAEKDMQEKLNEFELVNDKKIGEDILHIHEKIFVFYDNAYGDVETFARYIKNEFTDYYYYLSKGIQEGENDQIDPKTGKTIYQEQIESYNTAVGYYKDGELLTAKIKWFYKESKTYEEDTESKSTTISIKKNGERQTAEIEEHKQLNEDIGLEKFLDPEYSYKDVNFNYLFGAFGYQYDTTTKKITYNPSLNKIGPNLKYFEQ